MLVFGFRRRSQRSLSWSVFSASVQKRGFFPVEVAAYDPFDDPMIGTCSRADADAEIDLPFGRNIQVGHQEACCADHEENQTRPSGHSRRSIRHLR